MPEIDDAPRPAPAPGADCAPSVSLRIDHPQPARVYNALLGEKDNFPADREAAAQALLAFPTLGVTARENRAFMGRAVRYCAEQGVRQFLDIGTGIPSGGSTHEVAQQAAGDAPTRVVYVDNDPIVLAHARALLQGTGSSRTFYLDADLRDPARILVQARTHLDFEQPVALLLVAVLHFIEDNDDPYAIVQQLLDPLPAGSLLVLSHVTADERAAEIDRLVRTYRERGMSAQARSRVELERFVQGMQLIDPGVKAVSHWRPEAETDLPSSADVSCFGVVARKTQLVHPAPARSDAFPAGST